MFDAGMKNRVMSKRNRAEVITMNVKSEVSNAQFMRQGLDP